MLRHLVMKYVDVAYCYRPSRVVCLSVGLSVCHSREPCKNRWTDQDAVWVVDSGGPKEPRIWWGPDPPCKRAILRGKEAAHCKVEGPSQVSCAKTAEPIEMPFGMWTRVGPRKHALEWRCTLAQPSESDWTVHVRWQCSLFVKLLWPFVTTMILMHINSSIIKFKRMHSLNGIDVTVKTYECNIQQKVLVQTAQNGSIKPGADRICLMTSSRSSGHPIIPRSSSTRCGGLWVISTSVSFGINTQYLPSSGNAVVYARAADRRLPDHGDP